MGGLSMPKPWVRKKVYWINLVVSFTLATLTTILLKPILPPLVHPAVWFLVMFLTAYPFLRELVHVAGGHYTFAKHIAGALLGAAIGALVGYLFP
jgi:hypothetical protein